MNSLRASEHGIQLIDQARRKKRWTKTAEIWCDQGFTSRSTLNRFWAKHPIRQDAFVTICHAVGVNWIDVVEPEDVEDDGQNKLIEGKNGDRYSPLNAPLLHRTQQQHDFGDAPEANVIYGRQDELSRLKHWVVQDRCRLLLLLGMGGMGKTTLAAKLARTLDEDVDFVIWRSLGNAPPVSELLSDMISFLSQHQESALSASLDSQIRRLVHYLKTSRCLLVLDNVESLLEGGDRTGRYRNGYEGYGQLFKVIGDTPHQSCLVLTSREQPNGLTAVEGEHLPVRCLYLSGIQTVGGQALFMDKGHFTGSTDDWQTVIQHYAGNPLALKIVASAIRDFFNRDLSQFLEFVQHSPCLFDDIDDVLSKQFQRLTPLEQSIMYWLAINREPISFQDLWQDYKQNVPMGELLQSLVSLQRRALIEQVVPRTNPYTSESSPYSESIPTDQSTFIVNGHRAHENPIDRYRVKNPAPNPGVRFTQQPVVMDYVTHCLIEQVCEELTTQTTKWLRSHALMKAQTKDYVRNAQVRLILHPIIEHLIKRIGSRNSVVDSLTQMLVHGRSHPSQLPSPSVAPSTSSSPYLSLFPGTLAAPSFTLAPTPLALDPLEAEFPASYEPSRTQYLSGNLINLLQQLNTDFNGLDLSNLQIWQANFQGINLHHVNLSNADVAGSIFTETLGNILSVTFSSDGQVLATGDSTGDVSLWRVADGRKLFICQGHINWVWSVTFSPDNQTIASGSSDHTIRLWDVNTGDCLQVLAGHKGPIWSVEFSPLGDCLVSGSEDQTIKCWNPVNGECLQTFSGHAHWVRSVSISADGTQVASGSEDHTVKIWDMATGHCSQTIQENHRVWSVAFSPNDQLLASSSDTSVHLWDLETGDCRYQLKGHKNWVRFVTFCPEGRFLASASEDHTVKIWNSQTGHCCYTLQGHSNWVRSVAFSPDRQTLSTGSGDHTIKMWDIHTGQCIRTLQGYTNRMRTVALGTDSHTLVSGHDDHHVRIWNVKTGACTRQLRGHTNSVCSVAISPDDSILASASEDQTIRLWSLETGQCLRILRGHTNRIWSVAFTADQMRLVSGSEDQTIRVWDIGTGQCLHVLHGHTSWICSVATGSSHVNSSSVEQGDTVERGAIASGSYDQTIKIWSLSTGRCIRTLSGHDNWVWTVAFSPNGQLIATGSGDHTVKVWEVATGQCLQTLYGHDSRVWAVTFNSNGQTLASCSSDHTIKLWDVTTGECRRTLDGHTNLVWSIAFSADSRTLVSGSQDETIKQWDVETGQCLQTLRSARPYEGLNITGIRGLTDAQKQTLQILGAIAIFHGKSDRHQSKQQHLSLSSSPERNAEVS
ncbi:MAG: NB-ARC domain-containing protein [Cyanobacteria bacterium P01_E01_bin.6]